ncbi:MFS transporter [Dictyobacter formicarum]|uniref:MFS transporter n=1 Tax=Dictyobacter formicarum TaxID=2778368 RepID=A0ABQ3VPC7_9CHLR|nr:MFS transporter [Dictyobacter formicarum]GHO87519.1 MFS transporter [Dictyobacter formicarum]
MPYQYRWLAVIAVGLSLFLSALDATIVALALPVMAHHFQLSDSLASSITLSYAIPMTLLILPAGDLIGRFRVLPTFLVAVLGFGLGSLICGLAPNFLILLAGRVIQGGLGAVIATQGFAVAAAMVPPTERGRAVGLIGSLAPLGGVTGPGIGGLLLSHWNWPVIFFVNVPICLLAALLGFWSLRGVTMGDRHSGSRNGFQHMGALLRRPSFLWGLLGFLSSTTIAGGLYYLFPFDLSSVQHFTPSVAGVLLLCMPLGMGLIGFLAGYLADRYGARPLTLIGTGLLLVGLVLLLLVLSHPTSVLDCTWRLMLIGVGMGLFNGPNQALLMSVGHRETMGAASALSNLSARLGSVFGPLLLGILWSVLPGLALQMNGGGIVLAFLAVLCVFCAWIAKPQAQQDPRQGESAHVEQEVAR